MSTWVKYLVGLALALPMGAYVAGSLMASAADDPVNRDPVRIQDAPSETPRPSDEPNRKPPGSPSSPGSDVDDNGVRVVTPQPTRLDDGDDDDAGDDDRDDRDDRDGGDDDEDDSRDRSRDD